MMNRRQLLATAIGILATVATRASSVGPRQAVGSYDDSIVAMRKVLRRISQALPDADYDVRITAARTDVGEPMDPALAARTAFGIELDTIAAVRPAQLRAAHLARKDFDFRALNVVLADGYMLADCEFALAKILQYFDRI